MYTLNLWRSDSSELYNPSFVIILLKVTLSPYILPKHASTHCHVSFILLLYSSCSCYLYIYVGWLSYLYIYVGLLCFKYSYLCNTPAYVLYLTMYTMYLYTVKGNISKLIIFVVKCGVCCIFFRIMVYQLHFNLYHISIALCFHQTNDWLLHNLFLICESFMYTMCKTISHLSNN